MFNTSRCSRRSFSLRKALRLAPVLLRIGRGSEAARHRLDLSPVEPHQLFGRGAEESALAPGEAEKETIGIRRTKKAQSVDWTQGPAGLGGDGTGEHNFLERSPGQAVCREAHESLPTFPVPGVDVQARRHRRLPVGKLPEGFGKAERGFRGLTGVGCGGRRDQIVGNPRPPRLP